MPRQHTIVAEELGVRPSRLPPQRPCPPAVPPSRSSRRKEATGSLDEVASRRYATDSTLESYKRRTAIIQSCGGTLTDDLSARIAGAATLMSSRMPTPLRPKRRTERWWRARGLVLADLLLGPGPSLDRWPAELRAAERVNRLPRRPRRARTSSPARGGMRIRAELRSSTHPGASSPQRL